MNKLAIVGAETDTRDLAPWDDLEYDIWSFNEAGNLPWCKRLTGLIQIHLPEIYRSPFNRTDPHHWEWLQKEHGYPIWMQDRDNDVPDSIPYPIKAINRKYLTNFVWPDGDMIKFYCSTVPYALALAGHLCYEEVHLFGVEMRSNTEYQYQRDNVCFWTGLLLGQGIRIVQHCSQGIYDQPMYGYEGMPRYNLDRIREEELPYLQEQENKRIEEYNQALLIDIDAIGQEDYIKIHSKTIDAAIENGYAYGILSEANRYLKREAPSRHEFEQIAAGAGQNHQVRISMMNYESGRAEAYYSEGLYDKYKEAIKKQLELAYLSGAEKGKAYFNKVHIIEMDIMLRSAGGQRAADMVMEKA